MTVTILTNEKINVAKSAPAGVVKVILPSAFRVKSSMTVPPSETVINGIAEVFALDRYLSATFLGTIVWNHARNIETFDIAIAFRHVGLHSSVATSTVTAPATESLGSRTRFWLLPITSMASPVRVLAPNIHGSCIRDIDPSERDIVTTSHFTLCWIDGIETEHGGDIRWVNDECVFYCNGLVCIINLHRVFAPAVSEVYENIIWLSSIKSG